MLKSRNVGGIVVMPWLSTPRLWPRKVGYVTSLANQVRTQDLRIRRLRRRSRGLQQECGEHESFIETLEEELFDVEDNHDHDRVTERGCSFCGKHPKKVPYGYFKPSPAHGGGFIIGKFGTICFECIEEFVKLREDL
jgi:hypothetical protein